MLQLNLRSNIALKLKSVSWNILESVYCCKDYTELHKKTLTVNSWSAISPVVDCK